MFVSRACACACARVWVCVHVCMLEDDGYLRDSVCKDTDHNVSFCFLTSHNIPYSLE